MKLPGALLLVLLGAAHAASDEPTVTVGGEFICHALAECAPCTAAQEPSCAMFRNRRRLSCLPLRSGGQSDLVDIAVPVPALPPPPPSSGATSKFKDEASTGAQGALGNDPDPERLDDADYSDSGRVTTAPADTLPVGEIQKAPLELDARRLDARAGLEGRAGSSTAGGEVEMWEACQWVDKQERRDFFEFVVCNLVLGLISIAVLAYRHRQLAERQYGRLAARIGVTMTASAGD